MLPALTDEQLRILLFALDNLQGEIAGDLNGWTIGENGQTDIEPLCDNMRLTVEIDELRSTLQEEISNE